jgi:outer membrane protein assembly factor BamE (lipoprotein component of BamABCDE complex)
MEPGQAFSLCLSGFCLLAANTQPTPAMSTIDLKTNCSLIRALLAATTLATALVAGPAGGQVSQNGTAAAPLPESQRVRDFSDRTLAEIKPGHTTKAEVKALLGKPWRDSELDEEDVLPGDPAIEVWEYRGRDSQGTYRVHIRFDKRDVTTLIAKIPDKTARAVARVADPTPHQ